MGPFQRSVESSAKNDEKSHLDLIRTKMLASARPTEIASVLRKLLTTLLALAALISTRSSVFAQEKLRLAWAGVTPANAPVWTVQEKKLLQKQGVEPEIININASPTV